MDKPMWIEIPCNCSEFRRRFSLRSIGTATAHGWGIPMATDIAFEVGILVLLA
jgi:hypothetical protein